MTDFQIILSIQMKNQFILLKYIFICFYLLYCKSVNLHLQTTFKMFLNVGHISVRYSYQASIVTQRKFGPTTFINIIIMSPLRTKGYILLQSEFLSSPGLYFSSVIRRPSVNISHFNLLRNHWANCNQTLVEWSLDGPLPKLYPVIPTSNQDDRQAKNRKKGGRNFNCPLLLQHKSK